MSSIRPLERSDLPAAAALMEVGFPDVAPPPGGTEAALAEALFDQPWADHELPSLVGIDDDGRVVGFLACHVRRLRVGDRAIRAANGSYLVVDPSLPPNALGARLLARFIAGPQELSWSDTAVEVVARLWQAAGGQVDQTRSVSWSRTLRPLAWAGRMAAGVAVRRDLALGLAPIRPLPLGLRPVDEKERLDSRPINPAELARAAEAVSGGLPVRVAWDEEFATWLFRAVERRVGTGRFVVRSVLRRGVVVGWYAYARGAAGQGRVLHVAARRRELDAVVGELFAGARDDGMIVLTGRLEPQLREPLRARGCALGFGPRVVMHSRDAALLAEAGGPGGLLGLLEGDW